MKKPISEQGNPVELNRKPIENHALPFGLTPRENDVMRLVAKGMFDKEIADQLGISCGTVRNRARSAFVKLGAGNRTEAAIKWLNTEENAARGWVGGWGKSQPGLDRASTNGALHQAALMPGLAWNGGAKLHHSQESGNLLLFPPLKRIAQCHSTYNTAVLI